MRLRGHSRLLGVLLLLMAGSAIAQELPDDLTQLDLEQLLELELIPIDVLGSHIHLRGQWMVGYRFMHMAMEGGHVHEADYPVRPEHMRMALHMVEVMYGLTDRLTLMAMLGYQQAAMESRTVQGTRFETSASGPNDLQLAVHYALHPGATHYLVGLLGVQVPLGRVDVRDDTPMGTGQPLPYPMRPGSGTWDLVLGLTSIHRLGDWNLGVHGDALWRTGTNRYGYRLGHRVHAGAWVTYRVRAWMAWTLHVDAHVLGDVQGHDARLNPAMTPTADPALQGERHLTIQPALNFYVPGGPLKGMRWSVYLDRPLLEAHEGAAMETSWQLTLAWQWTR